MPRDTAFRPSQPPDPPLAAVVDSMRHRIATLRLDLTGLNVVTEAATGAYACTAVIAAMAGARSVRALARDTRRHGKVAEAAAATLDLARRAGVEQRITVVERLAPRNLSGCDILTNSGHLRPITRATIEALPQSCVIALMFEAWEFRAADLDLRACRDRGIRIAAVNERHPDVAVFPFLGPLCLHLLADAGYDPAGRRVTLLCDNPFAPFIVDGLARAGGRVDLQPDIHTLDTAPRDAIVVALDPDRNPPLGKETFARLAGTVASGLIAQFWGDIDRAAARTAGFALWPPEEPGRGHMGILLGALGPEPITRLQTGGLRAAEFVFRSGAPRAGAVAELL